MRARTGSRSTRETGGVSDTGRTMRGATASTASTWLGSSGVPWRIKTTTTESELGEENSCTKSIRRSGEMNMVATAPKLSAAIHQEPLAISIPAGMYPGNADRMTGNTEILPDDGGLVLDASL